MIILHRWFIAESDCRQRPISHRGGVPKDSGDDGLAVGPVEERLPHPNVVQRWAGGVHEEHQRDTGDGHRFDAKIGTGLQPGRVLRGDLPHHVCLPGLQRGGAGRGVGEEVELDLLHLDGLVLVDGRSPGVVWVAPEQQVIPRDVLGEDERPGADLVQLVLVSPLLDGGRRGYPQIDLAERVEERREGLAKVDAGCVFVYHLRPLVGA